MERTGRAVFSAGLRPLLVVALCNCAGRPALRFPLGHNRCPRRPKHPSLVVLFVSCEISPRLRGPISPLQRGHSRLISGHQAHQRGVLVMRFSGV